MQSHANHASPIKVVVIKVIKGTRNVQSEDKDNCLGVELHEETVNDANLSRKKKWTKWFGEENNQGASMDDKVLWEKNWS